MLLLHLPATYQKFHFAPLRKCTLRQSLKIVEHGIRWSVDSYRDPEADVEHWQAEGFAVIRKAGVEVARWVPMQAPFCGAYRVDISPGYPVFAVRGEWGLGSHWDTMLFAIRHGRLIRMGRPPAMNSNGPILWHGNPKLWAFDNFDRYQNMHDHLRLARVFMKVNRAGKLVPWRTDLQPHPQIPTTIHTPDDLQMPKTGL